MKSWENLTFVPFLYFYNPFFKENSQLFQLSVTCKFKFFLLKWSWNLIVQNEEYF